jgi:hypothetical protein
MTLSASPYESRERLSKGSSYKHFSSIERSSYPHKPPIEQPGPSNKPLPKPSIQNKTKATQCFKCQGFGHIASDCPTRRTITIIKGEAYEEHEEIRDDLEKEEESEPVYDEELVVADQGESLIIRRSLHASTKEAHWLRNNIFHTRCTVAGKVCDVIIDSGSCENVVSNYMVDKLKLPTESHPHSYNLQWFNDGSEVKVTKRCLVTFSIGEKYKDQVWCDVVPMDACHLLLGRPWQYDRRVHQDCYANTYSFFKDGIKIKLTPLPPSELDKSKKKVKPLVSLITKVEEVPNGMPPMRDIQHAESRNIGSFASLQVPKPPWENIDMGFVLRLPQTQKQKINGVAPRKIKKALTRGRVSSNPGRMIENG